jgi:soluble lytic murein transglycosylase-like protein
MKFLLPHRAARRIVARFALAALTASFAVAWAGPSQAASSAREYVSMRRRVHCSSQLRYADVQQDVAAYAGRWIELRGVIDGSVGTEDGFSVNLTLQDGTSVDLIVPGEQRSELAETVRRRVCALVQVGTQSSAGNVAPLTVKAMADEAEVVELETAAQARAQAQRARRVVRKAGAPEYRTGIASRGTYARPVPDVYVSGPVAARYSSYLSERARPLFGAYFQYVMSMNRRLTAEQAGEITASLLHFADLYNIDPRLVVAMIVAESDFNPNATSRTGAAGLGQLMPGTARALGVDNPYDPVQNIAGSVSYLRSRIDTFADHAMPDGGMSIDQVALALAAYNAGSGAVRRYHGIPPYRETQAYVRRVMSYYLRLTGQ